MNFLLFLALLAEPAQNCPITAYIEIANYTGPIIVDSCMVGLRYENNNVILVVDSYEDGIFKNGFE